MARPEGNLGPVELTYDSLAEPQIAAALGGVPTWTLSEGSLVRLFEFRSYKEALVFAAAVGWVADKLNHHPDILIGYQKVRIATVTHDTGGLTAYDFELARRIDALADLD
ncbi:MAG: 4a-hydroxytetrahydrobiopterin dehydratase [Fimbriimonadaceae bacterium]|nr:4a-hydroxytetrahydrobiopterin dehydratase [Fimbriimonadaceae bacterium]QYK55370.1 MAG: 4a-hydroxytetrahydrobiopterin dehydratase [Fimbriimonadaceae bacterium]